MPTERVSMRKIREVLRLKWVAHLSFNRIAASCGLSKGAVIKYLRLAEKAKLTWPLPEGLDDQALEALLIPAAKPKPSVFAPPDYPAVHLALRQKSVTRQLLWEEYKEAHPEDGYNRSRFFSGYSQWAEHQKRSMKQTHKAGERLFVDYSGLKIPVVNRLSGESKDAEIFVAVLGASSYTFAEATHSQGLADWTASHVRTFEFIGGVPAVLVPDNLKSAVTKTSRYEPLLNQSYQEMARHYGTVILPARPYKPKDKAKAEAGVQLVQRWILAKLRHQTFFSLAELNQAIAKLLKILNEKPFKKMEGSRLSWFEAIDKPALKALPATRYEYGKWEHHRVNIDYHVEVDSRFYSVPHSLVGQQIDTRLSAGVVELFHKGKRVASHPRSFNKYQHTSISEHLPKSHQKYAEWTPDRFLRWAGEIGPSTRQVVDYLLTTRPHPEHGFRSCLGLFRLGKTYTNPRLEAACARAMVLKSPRYSTVKSILERGMDQQPLPGPAADDLFVLPPHDNVRGPYYYS